MTSCGRNWRSWTVGFAVALLLTASVAYAGPRAKKQSPAPEPATVEMFSAIEKGDLAVQVIFKDSTQCRVRIENKTDKPLSVKLPDAFAGVPVLAQFGGAGGGVGAGGGRAGRGGSGSSSSGGQQTMGGGMGMMGGMGMFNVAPEKVGQFDVPAVCLEHGKDEPRVNIPYAIKPIDDINTKPGVRELCQMLGSGKVNQRAAQAAAWHLNNEMTWEQLAAESNKRANGTREPYFTPADLRLGMELAAAAVRSAEERNPKKTGIGTSQD